MTKFRVKVAHKLQKAAQKISKSYKQRYRDEVRAFLRDLNNGILANSPQLPGSRFSSNSYVNHTYIRGSNVPLSSADMPRMKKEFSAAPVTRFGARGAPLSQVTTVPNVINGLGQTSALFNRWKTIPDYIYIWNRSVGEKNYDYTLNIQTSGWTATPPYKTFQKGWKYAISKHPKLFGRRVYKWKA